MKEKNVKWVDVQFTDLLGRLRRITVRSKDFDERCFTEGFGKLDGRNGFHRP